SYEQSPLCKNCGANLSDIDAVSPVALVGALLENRYQLVEYLDEGAMAYVYRGVHVDVGSSVAVKILKSNFQTDERFVERFQLEARAAGALNHPNILSVITVGSSPSGLTYLISEFVQGITLNKLIGREGRISLDRTVNIVNQILTALDEAHSHGIIHRDIKPENIMITQLRSREEFVKLLDFGIARQIYQQTPRLTMPGELFGTPEFMAPEVIRGQEATISADLYAVGVVLYEMLTGHTPFAGEGLFNILKSHLETSPEPMSKYNPEIPSGMEKLILSALNKDPEQRPPSAMDFKFMLENVLNLTPVPTLPCPKCRASVTADQRFCPNCGLSMQKIVEETPAPAGDVGLKLSTVDSILYDEGDVEMPFSGRESELDSVSAFLFQDLPILEVNGPLGIGKTTFLRQIAALQRAENIACHIVSPDPTMACRPWHPVRDLFWRMLKLPPMPTERQVLEIVGTYSIETDDEAHVVQFLTAMPAKNEIERAVRLRERVTSILRLLLAAIGKTPHLLLFDDVHEFDYMSRMFVDRLVSVARGFPLKIIVTSETPHIQPGELGQSMILTRLDDDLIAPLVLRNLKVANEESYHNHAFTLCQSAMGLPLHVSEGIHLLLEGGVELSSNLSDIIQTRLRRLPPKAMRLLQLSTCYGDEIPLSLLHAAEGLNDAFQEALRVLIKRGFLQQADAEHVRLRHPVYARMIPAQITASVRLDFHAIILDYLEGENGPCHLMARHALAAGMLEQAVPHLECSGNVCEEDLDDYSAVENYKQAYDIIKIATLHGQELAHFAQLSARLGDLYRFTGQIASAEEVLKEGLLVCEDSPSEEAVILSSLARLTMNSLKDEERAGTLINRATRKARESSDPALLYRVYFDLSTIELARKRFSQGALMLREGLKVVSSLSNSPMSFWRLFLRLAEFEFQAGQQEEAVRILMNALSVGETTLAELPKGRIHYMLGQFFLRMGRPHDAEPHMQKAVEYLQNIGDRQGAAEASLTIAESPTQDRERYLDRAMYLSMQIGWKQGLEKVESLRHPTGKKPN
ncbi:MAG: hypothetical protein CVU65_15160, partial [Deltaproteobacteria bacterium HGW-Deltaproteobacteria-22]